MENDLVTVQNNPNPPINLQIINYHNVVDISNTNSSVDILSDMNIRVKMLENTKEPIRTSGQNYVNDAQLAQLDKTSGINTGDETQASIKSKLGISNLSGSNTGDETAATIKSKLGVTALSGANTGDETQSTIISKLGGTSISSIGTCSTASATTEKAVVLPALTALSTGATVEVTFSNTNTAAAPTLNVNSLGAKPIASEGGTVCSATNPFYVPAGASVEFTYNGTNWVYKNRVITNYRNNGSWYRQYSDGFIEQGGYWVNPSSSINSSGNTIPLFKNFSDTNYILLTTPYQGTYNVQVAAQLVTGYISKTTSSFTVRSDNNAYLNGYSWYTSGY